MRVEIARPLLGAEEEAAVAAVIRSGWVAQGPKVREFEERFATYVGAKHAVAMSSCTTALHAALAVSGVGPGDEVVVPSLSFIATANAVVHAGARPVFADVDPETCNVDPDAVERALTPRTRALMPVHQMGLPADLDRLRALAVRHGLLLLEDAACAIGARHKGVRIGGTGAMACFSFHPRKVITTGEGGMVTTDDDEAAARLRRFRHHGMSISDLDRHLSGSVLIESYVEKAYNYRMTDLQAAMGVVQLGRLPHILERRAAIAARYDEAFRRLPHVRVPAVPPYAEHNRQSYWLELLPGARLGRNALMERLLERGIATRRGIMAIHLEPCYRADAPPPLPMTERLTENTIILPLHPAMSEAETGYVIEALAALLG